MTLDHLRIRLAISMNLKTVTVLTVPFCNMHTEKFKNQLVIVFFAAVNHDYHDNQQTLKKRKKENGATLPITTHRPDILSPLKFFYELLFPERSTWIIDCSKNATILSSFCVTVCKRHSKMNLSQDPWFWPLLWSSRG